MIAARRVDNVMSKKNRIITSIDIGTTKIAALCGEVEDGSITVIGCSTQPSYGVKKGVIINMDSTVDSIKRALEDLETMTGLDITAAVAGISGSHIKGMSSTGVVPLSSREVKKADITSVLEAAKAVVIPTDREVIQIVPQEFVVDDQDGIKEPLGMSGVRLESRVYIVTGAVAAAQNVIRCLNRSGLKAQDIVLQHFASAEAVLTEDEKELGCALVDIGGGTTDIAIFSQGYIRACAVLPIGGTHITSDIAIGIRTPLAEAEELKRNFGTACPDKVDANATIEIGCIGEPGRRTVSRHTLAQIIHARIEETMTLVHKEITSAGFGDSLPAGVVITGGTAMLDGIVDVAQEVLGMPVRIGVPMGVSGLNDVRSPLYAGAVGLLQFTARGSLQEQAVQKKALNFMGFGERMRQWFAEAF